MSIKTFCNVTYNNLIDISGGQIEEAGNTGECRTSKKWLFLVAPAAIAASLIALILSEDTSEFETEKENGKDKTYLKTETIIDLIRLLGNRLSSNGKAK